jgi:formate dehydrogenase iron-sulfur subunit
MALALLPLGVAPWFRIATAALVIGGEFIGRYLFFVSVVPTNMARGYLAQESA